MPSTRPIKLDSWGITWEEYKELQYFCLQYEQKKRENAQKRALEKKIERAKARIEELESLMEELDSELFGSAASDYVRAAEIDRKKTEIEEELLSLYELVM